MKTRLKLFALILFALAATPGLEAQTLTTLHSFTANYLSYPYTNSDGANPSSSLILSGNTLYGTTDNGGSANQGTVFKVNTDGTGFTNLLSFAVGSYGAEKVSSLIISGNTLYGTAVGGSSEYGLIFAVNTDGTGFTNLHFFTVTSGFGFYGSGPEPQAGLIISGNTLYGTTPAGGSANQGTVFAVNTDGTGFTNLHSFTTNIAGANPYAGLVLSGNILYGTTLDGFSGTVFAINTDGTGFTNLYVFTALSSSNHSTNTDGFEPQAGLIISGNTLYGTAGQGGDYGYGTVFKVNTDGTGFTNLHNFTDAINDGSGPYGLILSGNTLYGTTVVGGIGSYGTLFKVNTDGTGYTNLPSFTLGNYNSSFVYTNSNGANPQASLIISGNTLYGTAFEGGSGGNGTVFSLSLGSAASAPQLAIIRSGTNVLLTWPTNAAGFTLQSVTNLSSGIWSNITSGITTVGTNYTFTNPVNGKASFFRLMQ